MTSTLPSTRERLWHPRGIPCAVCWRPARGFGWREPFRSSRPRPDRWFCSITCQAFWSSSARRRSVVDLTEQERAAMRAALKPVAELMEEIGWATPLAGLSEAQVLTLIEAAVGAFQEAMAASAARASTEIPF
ncbi:DUF6511 domain-containing protein [Ancylobacter moscoviensis]|uniref:DUF6511 domain-containing protein n=1 Tax=Ancylobacter moscoviensis TaxID=2597768 RepID=UPI001AEDE057|nr:DUF6511 domain-containing protein [Ancylobacter moscoviensis]